MELQDGKELLVSGVVNEGAFAVRARDRKALLVISSFPGIDKIVSANEKDYFITH